MIISSILGLQHGDCYEHRENKVKVLSHKDLNCELLCDASTGHPVSAIRHPHPLLLCLVKPQYKNQYYEHTHANLT